MLNWPLKEVKIPKLCEKNREWWTEHLTHNFNTHRFGRSRKAIKQVRINRIVNELITSKHVVMKEKRVRRNSPQALDKS